VEVILFRELVVPDARFLYLWSNKRSSYNPGPHARQSPNCLIIL